MINETELAALTEAVMNAATDVGFHTLRRERLFAALEALDAAARVDDTDPDWPIIFRAVSRMFDEAKANERDARAHLASL
jgi:hypothetical protein